MHWLPLPQKLAEQHRVAEGARLPTLQIWRSLHDSRGDSHIFSNATRSRYTYGRRFAGELRDYARWSIA